MEHGHEPNIEVLAEDGGGCVVCSGELDLGAAAELGGAISAALELGATCWIDLRRVAFMDSSAIQELIFAVRKARALGVCLLIVPASTNVMRPFEMLGLMGVLPFADRLLPPTAKGLAGLRMVPAAGSSLRLLG